MPDSDLLIKDELLDLELMFLGVMEAGRREQQQHKKKSRLTRRLANQFGRMKARGLEMLVCCARVDGVGKAAEGLGELMQQAVVPPAPRHSASLMRSSIGDVMLDSMDAGPVLGGHGDKFNWALDQGGEEEDPGGYYEWGDAVKTPRLCRAERNFAALVLQTLEEDRAQSVRRDPEEHEVVCSNFKQLRLSVKRALTTKALADAHKDAAARAIQKAWFKWRRQPSSAQRSEMNKFSEAAGAGTHDQTKAAHSTQLFWRLVRIKRKEDASRRLRVDE